MFSRRYLYDGGPKILNIVHSLSLMVMFFVYRLFLTYSNVTCKVLLRVKYGLFLCAIYKGFYKFIRYTVHDTV